jgi:hypothetical protein
MTMARQLADVSAADLGLRSLWVELDVKDIEDKCDSQARVEEALRSVYEARQILDLESPLVRTLSV